MDSTLVAVSLPVLLLTADGDGVPFAAACLGTFSAGASAGSFFGFCFVLVVVSLPFLLLTMDSDGVLFAAAYLGAFSAGASAGAFFGLALILVVVSLPFLLLLPTFLLFSLSY